jgi:hypothetical protein
MSLRTRLQRLERNSIDVGCPACHDRRGRIALQIVEQLTDGTVAVPAEGPQPCVQCGQIPERVIQVVETVVAPPTPSP